MEIQETDERIIYEMDFGARIPLSRLGKRLRISKQVAKYRLESLTRKGIIQGFYTDINPSRIGMQIYLVYFSFQGISPEKEKNLINQVSRQKSVGVNSSLNGKWDHCIGIWAESVFHFRKYYKKTVKGYEKYLKNVTVMIETDFFYFKPRQIFDKKETRQIEMLGSIKSRKIDGVDRSILSLMSENGRISLVDLSLALKMTPNAVKARLKKLEKDKIILGYRVMINYQLLDFLHYRIFLHLENMDSKKESAMMGFLKNNKTVVSITKTIGHCDMEFRAVFRSIHEFYSLMEELRNSFPDSVREYESVIYYKFYKPLNYFPFK